MTAIPSPYEMTPHALEVLSAYLEPEVTAAWTRGYDFAMRAAGLLVDDERAGANLKALALLPSHADVLERRGQHQAALEYRAMLAGRGLT